MVIDKLRLKKQEPIAGESIFSDEATRVADVQAIEPTSRNNRLTPFRFHR